MNVPISPTLVSTTCRAFTERVRLWTNHPPLLAAAQRALSVLCPCEPSAPAEEELAVHFWFPPETLAALAQPRGKEHLPPDWGGIRLTAEGDLFVLRMGESCLVVTDGRRRFAYGLVPPQFALSTEFIAETLVRVPVQAWFDVCGIVRVHASALSREGRGVLIVGDRGGGKTTGVVALARDGWRVHSDSHSYLREWDNTFKVLPRREDIRVRPDLLRLYPELQAEAAHRRREEGKVVFPMGEPPFAAAASPSPVHLVLFLRLTRSPNVRVHPIPTGQAVPRLQAHVKLWADQPLEEPHHRLIQRLAAQAACYDIVCGDVPLLPAVVERLLEEKRHGLDVNA